MADLQHSQKFMEEVNTAVMRQTRMITGDCNIVRFRQACVSREDGAGEWRELWKASPHTCRFHSDEEFVPFDVIACSSGPPAGKGLIK